MDNKVTECPISARNIFENVDSFSTINHVKSELIFGDCIEDSPSMSVLVPTYNSYLVLDAIKSSLEQVDAPEYEVIIVDNHSDEQFFHPLLEYVKSCGNRRVRLYRNDENVGMYGNWNRCIELAKGKYVTFLHSDDLLKQSCLKDLWECHLRVEEDAAIIGLEEMSYTDGRHICSDRIPSNHLFGIIKGRYFYKRRKVNLLTPGGNGCGHLFSKEALVGIGGYSVSGDCGAMLRYQLSHPVYDLYRITRVKRVGENESVNAAKDFASYGYHIKLQVIERFFPGNKLLLYLSRLEYEGASISIYNVGPARRLHFYEKAFVKIWKGLLYVISRYSL